MSKMLKYLLIVPFQIGAPKLLSARFAALPCFSSSIRMRQSSKVPAVAVEVLVLVLLGLVCVSLQTPTDERIFRVTSSESK